MELSALTLIESIIEFARMTSGDHSDWCFKKQKDNLPRLIRLQQIEVLISVFIPELSGLKDIKTKIENVINGEFIEQRPISYYNELLLDMEKTIKKSEQSWKKTNRWESSDLRHNFTDLLNFKMLISKLLQYNNGIMEISYPYLYSYVGTKNVIKKIEKIADNEFDQFLSLVIDPRKNDYSLEQLINGHNYPVEDLSEIDFDWM